MKSYGVNELRRMYLDFFESKGHLKLNSFSLVPHGDKSLLLINAGMAPLKPYFTGQEIPPRKRVTTCQKCIRTGDIENVGKTARHLTFFEMLGNFSFGDYFKHEAIAWSWEFLTKVLGLDPERLYPSIYGEDDEAFSIWTEEIGVPGEKIKRFYRDENGDCDNFWEHGAGPCGPCSEIYYDRGEKYGCGKPTCGVGCDCDRFMEIWNNVFTQFEGDGHHGYTELKNKNIDTGMGLERLAVVMQDVDTVFDIDTMKAIRDHVCRLAGREYEKNDKDDISIMLITDHIRSVTFMTSDGILPSNEGRGYVLRRLLRRAARHGRLLGIQGEFLAKLAETVINESADGYQELEDKKDYILKVITNEEEKFNKTIDQGLSILNTMAEECSRQNKSVLSGTDAFKLYDTYGFPLDLTQEILEEKGIAVDTDAFDVAMKVQRQTAHDARKTTNYMGADATVYDKIDTGITSKFVGYDRTQTDSFISVLTNEEELTGSLVAGEKGTIITDETPFYATMGGQTADTGEITSIDKNEDGSFKAVFTVEDTVKLKGGRIGHVGTVSAGIFKKGDKVRLSINTALRSATEKNHSATHLLQEALRQVLGNHVEQAGSLVTPTRLRFDFSHFAAMTKEELEKVEAIVNTQIQKNLPIQTESLPIDEAKKTGAKALFGEKYGSVVRVVSMGDFSKEFCGGTHAENTGAISLFKILSESGVAAGVRRIEALTGDNVINYYKKEEAELFAACEAAKDKPDTLVNKIEDLFAEIRSLKSENEALKSKIANESIGDVMSKIKVIKGVKVLAAEVPEMQMDELRSLSDSLKEKLGEGLIYLASVSQGKVNLVVAATDTAIKSGISAGNIIKATASFVGGKGGGRPNMAQAGGNSPEGIKLAIEKAYEEADKEIKG